MSTSITSIGITDGQRRQVTRMMKDIARHGTGLVLEKVETNTDGWQRLLARGDEMKYAIAELIVAKAREFTVSDQFADEEVESTYGYLSGYTKPVSITDQIDILRGHWPTLNPDGAIRYMAEVYPKLRLPSWIEGPFALIRPGFFSNLCGEELEEILKALKKARLGKVINYRKGFGEKQLHQSVNTLAKLARIIEQQPGSDIIVVPSQFSIRHRGKSVRRAREVFIGAEFGHGAKDAGTMILTNPIRLPNFDDLWIDCAGDEFSSDADGVFDRAPYWSFYDGYLRLGTGVVDSAVGHYGSVSGVCPQ